MNRVYKHPELKEFVKHVKGNIFVECCEKGVVILKTRPWTMSRMAQSQPRLITDKSKLIQIN